MKFDLNNILKTMTEFSFRERALRASGSSNGTQRYHHRNLATLLFLCMLCLLFSTPLVMANNIQIANGRVVQDGADRFIEFDLNWENSWRTDNLNEDGVTNWDAAWVFVKYRVPASEGGDDLWKHVWLSTDDGHHDPGTGTPATVNIGTTDIGGTNRGMGAFIYRSVNGTGTFSTNGTRLRWDVTEQVGHLGFSATEPVEIRIFAIEMVYVAEGAFFVGSGGGESGHFNQADDTSAPFEITSEGAITTANSGEGNLWGAGGTDGNNAVAPSDGSDIPADFPKGFAAFYMMKYSITQQQYVDFLNTLTRDQQQERFSSTTVGNFMHSSDDRTSPANRNGVRLISDPGGSAPRVFGCDLNNNNTASEANDGQWIAMNWMSWMDGAAYMDWAGLRPMTELEYEKAARGFAAPVADEYAWGTASINNTSSRYTLNNQGAANEGIATNYNTTGTVGNANYAATRPEADQGPMRVGIFAANASNTGRATSGASYWGIMELSGNVWERSVTVGNGDGRNFTGLHGDGALSTNGHATVTNWPGLSSGNEVTGADGSGFRGGSWQSNVARLGVSERELAANTSTNRRNGNGFRGVRSAPAAGVEE